jgi:uncharacterized RDD family membrane protein YckC
MGKRASLPTRAVAVLIDGLLVGLVVGVPLAAFTGGAHTGQGSASISLNGWTAGAWVAIAYGYWIVCERLWGATIGKRAVGVRVVRESGARISWWQSIVRNVLRLVDGFPYLIPYLLGAGVAVTNAERRRIGDFAASTRVVHPPDELELALRAEQP